MPLVRDRCICLRRTEYSETSQILTLFSRAHGIVRAIAKGAHRRTKAGASKFDGGVDLLDTGDAVFTHDPGKDLATLTEWSLREGHLGLRTTLRGMYLGLYAAELVGRLVEEHDPHPELFDRLDATLGELATPRAEEAFLAFELDLLRETGYLAELVRLRRRAATPISEREPTFFSPARGGVVCRNCEGVDARPHPVRRRGSCASCKRSSASPAPTAPPAGSPSSRATRPTRSTASSPTRSSTRSAGGCSLRRTCSRERSAKS